MAEAPQEVGPGMPASRGVPTLVAVALVIAAIGLTLSLFRELSSIIAPMFLAVNLILVAYPLFRWLVRVRVPRLVAAVATGLAVFIVLILGIGALVWSVSEMVVALGSYRVEFVELYDTIIAFLTSLGFDQSSLLDQLRSISPSSVLDFAGSILSSTSAASGIIAVIVVAIVFMVIDMPTYSNRMAITNRLHPNFTGAIAAFVAGVRRYWVVTTVFGLIVAMLDWLALVILAVPLPLVWAILAFITNYIPNIGFVIGVVPPALLALFEQGPGTALIVVAAYSVLNFVIQSLIQPKVTGAAVGISPTVSFLSLLLWAWVFGPLGALIAIPATLAVKALLVDADPRLRWVNAFISADPLKGDHPPGDRRTACA